ncbi:MAG: hypothetical protein ACRYGG_15650 [Janthinobacterium lividum]
MSLPKGSDQKTIATNIKIAETNMHKPHNVAVAIALQQAGKPKPIDSNKAADKG